MGSKYYVKDSAQQFRNGVQHSQQALQRPRPGTSSKTNYGASVKRDVMRDAPPQQSRKQTTHRSTRELSAGFLSRTVTGCHSASILQLVSTFRTCNNMNYTYAMFSSGSTKTGTCSEHTNIQTDMSRTALFFAGRVMLASICILPLVQIQVLVTHVLAATNCNSYRR